MRRKADKPSPAGKPPAARTRSPKAAQKPKLLMPQPTPTPAATAPTPRADGAAQATANTPAAPCAEAVLQNTPASQPETNEAPVSKARAAPVPVEVQPAAPVPAPNKPLPVPLSAWQVCGVAVTGLAHHRKGLPCQDAVAWRQQPRVVLALSDGAGSAVISERGAAALVRGMSRFVLSLEDAMAAWLDQAGERAADELSAWARRLLAHAQGLLADLAQAERRSVQDVRATLLLVVLGTAHSFWWQVGDGTIVVQSAQGLQALSSHTLSKGEFANQTCFVDAAQATDVQCGLLVTADVQGVALMSDGGAEKLVSSQSNQVAQRLATWLADLGRKSLTPDGLAVAYHDPAMNERTTLDDRSIVLAARQAQPATEQDGVSVRRMRSNSWSCT